MKVFYSRFLFRFGLLFVLGFGLYWDVSRAKIPSVVDVVVFALVAYLAFFGLTLKVVADDIGLHFRCMALPLLNESVPWRDVKRAGDYGLLNKELEYFSAARNILYIKGIGAFDPALISFIQKKISG